MDTWLINLLGAVGAFVASLIGAFSGGGSSLILFPILLIISPFGFVPLLTISKTSAAVMTVSSGKIHVGKNKLKKSLLAILACGCLIGTAIGTYLVQYQLNESLFKGIMGIVMLISAVLSLCTKTCEVADNRKLSIKMMLLIGIFSLSINILNGIFGGTGLLTTIFTVLILRLPFLEASAYTMISYAGVNVLQSVYLLASEYVPVGLLLAVLAGSLLGGLAGTHLQYLKGNLWVKRASVTMMVVIGIKMLFSIGW